ncbi:hypothetical protein Stsp01_65830 [Streptomyces sp. NBRC 13847]|nr:hypothetical protein Stsp01_65830 [Streptomyces sp. NBRC 13847]
MTTRPWIADDDFVGADQTVAAAVAETCAGAATGCVCRALPTSCTRTLPGNSCPRGQEFVSEQTCWRRLDRWQKAGDFEQLHRILLAELNAAGELDWNRACVDGSHVRAQKGESRPVRHRSTGRRRAANTT